MGSHSTNLTPPYVSCACLKSGIVLIGLSLCYLFCYMYIFRKEQYYFTYTHFYLQQFRVFHKEWYSTLVEGLVETSVFLMVESLTLPTIFSHSYKTKNDQLIETCLVCIHNLFGRYLDITIFDFWGRSVWTRVLY